MYLLNDNGVCDMMKTVRRGMFINVVVSLLLDGGENLEGVVVGWFLGRWGEGKL
jgi:hypothetical protein